MFLAYNLYYFMLISDTVSKKPYFVIKVTTKTLT